MQSESDFPFEIQTTATRSTINEHILKIDLIPKPSKNQKSKHSTSRTPHSSSNHKIHSNQKESLLSTSPLAANKKKLTKSISKSQINKISERPPSPQRIHYIVGNQSDSFNATSVSTSSSKHSTPVKQNIKHNREIEPCEISDLSEFNESVYSEESIRSYIKKMDGILDHLKRTQQLRTTPNKIESEQTDNQLISQDVTPNRVTRQSPTSASGKVKKRSKPSTPKGDTIQTRTEISDDFDNESVTSVDSSISTNSDIKRIKRIIKNPQSENNTGSSNNDEAKHTQPRSSSEKKRQTEMNYRQDQQQTQTQPIIKQQQQKSGSQIETRNVKLGFLVNSAVQASIFSFLDDQLEETNNLKVKVEVKNPTNPQKQENEFTGSQSIFSDQLQKEEESSISQAFLSEQIEEEFLESQKNDSEEHQQRQLKEEQMREELIKSQKRLIDIKKQLAESQKHLTESQNYLNESKKKLSESQNGLNELQNHFIQIEDKEDSQTKQETSRSSKLLTEQQAEEDLQEQQNLYNAYYSKQESSRSSKLLSEQQPEEDLYESRKLNGLQEQLDELSLKEEEEEEWVLPDDHLSNKLEKEKITKSQDEIKTLDPNIEFSTTEIIEDEEDVNSFCLPDSIIERSHDLCLQKEESSLQEESQNDVFVQEEEETHEQASIQNEEGTKDKILQNEEETKEGEITQNEEEEII